MLNGGYIVVTTEEQTTKLTDIYFVVHNKDSGAG
jgi:hypothetical protein